MKHAKLGQTLEVRLCTVSAASPGEYSCSDSSSHTVEKVFFCGNALKHTQIHSAVLCATWASFVIPVCCRIFVHAGEVLTAPLVQVTSSCELSIQNCISEFEVRQLWHASRKTWLSKLAHECMMHTDPSSLDSAL